MVDRWHSMDSAPTGESVIVYAGISGGGIGGLYVGEAYHKFGPDGEDEGWWWANTAPGDFDPSDQIYPVVWMPLPDAPKFEVAG